MIKLTFNVGGEVAQFKIENREIFFSGKPTNYSYVKWNPIMTANNIARLRAKKGENWYKNYLEAEERFEKMKTEDEIAEDLIGDFEKSGMKLIKRETL